MKLNYKLVSESYKLKLGEAVYFNGSGISLVSARRDWAAFQILLQDDDEFTLSLGKNTNFPYKNYDPLSGKMRPIDEIRLQTVLHGMPEAAVKMYHVGLIEDDDGIRKADILLNDENSAVEYRRSASVWVEVLIPDNARPGLYKGEVRIYRHSMFEDEEKVDALPFEIHVKNVLMPEPKNYGFHLDLWQHLSNISRKHEVKLWSERHFQVIEEYVKSLAGLGQKAVTVIASEIPWSGQGCYKRKEYLSDMYEYNIVRITRNSGGKYLYDFSAAERYLDMCFKHGIDKEIEVFGLIDIWTDEKSGFGKVAMDYPDAIRIRYYDEASECFRFLRTAEEIIQYIKALESFFKQKGLIDRVRVVADEPADVELYNKRLALLKEAAPSFRYKTAVDHAEFIGQFKDKISDFSSSLPCVSEEWQLLQSLKGNIAGRLTWYVANTPEFPNTLIRSPLLESRLIGLLTAYMEFDGFLRWNYTVWPEKPREKITLGIAGDTNFVYPANDGTPLLTLRYKNLKRGIEDFELIQLLRKVSPEAEIVLDKIWSKILKERDIREYHPSKKKTAGELYSLNYEDYQWAKEKILDELAAVENKNGSISVHNMERENPEELNQ